MDFVDERNDLPVGVLDLLQHGLEPFLEFAAVLRAGHHGCEVQRDEGLAPQAFRDVTCHHALGEAFDDGGLADAGFADQHGVVLGAAAQDLDHSANFAVPPDHGIQLAGARDGGEVRAVFLKRLEGVFRVLRGNFPVTADTRQGGEERFVGGAGVAQ
ncbi:conserved hypothetical protein [Arthrobacter sp. Hiyo1]|nr:conserved hypothetical protein [Arthrobacter sp. Hiyo1]